MEKKKTYKITASLLNSWLYHMGSQSKSSMKSLVDSLENKFKGNKWTRRGTIFEQEVVEGKHGKLSEIIKPLKKQVWCEKILETKDFKLRIAGKLDALDENKKVIYDIKRVDRYFEGKYDEDKTVQHLFYFYLNPEVKDFYYLIVEGEGNEIVKQHLVHKTRPEEKELEAMVLEKIVDFINFLKVNDLWEVYKKNQEISKNKK